MQRCRYFVLLQVREHGRNGLQAQVLRLNIQQAPPGSSSSSSNGSQQQQQQPLVSVRVLSKEVHMNSVSLTVENFRFMFCPPDRLVSVSGSSQRVSCFALWLL
jgi:hypothetical protein